MSDENRKAFLDMIGFSEGTTRIPESDDGYRALVGGGTFQSYADHPRKRIFISRLGLFSTAAGKFQILARYYDAYKKLLGLKDFSPASQDAIALQMIKEQHALIDVDAGCLECAVGKCRNIWASLPGAGYGQHEQHMADLVEAYVDAGGSLA